MSFEIPPKVDGGDGGDAILMYRSPHWRKGLLVEKEVDEKRHLHCRFYEQCLDDAIVFLRKDTTKTFICPGECLGWETFVKFEMPRRIEELCA